MSKIDISIIVPIYNAEKYLKKCLNSLIKQSKKELEFILVNDGSTDNSEKIIKTYKDPRIKYFKNKNQGIGKTRNFGIEKSNGKYLMFLDSDDFLDLKACELLFKKIEKDKLDIVICDFYKHYENKKEEKIHQESFKNSSLRENVTILNEYLSPWAKIYRKDLIIKNNLKFVENLKYEDAPFVLMALDKATKIGKLDCYLFYYVIHGNSETTILDEKVFDILEIIKIIREYFKEKIYAQEEINKLTVRIITNYTIQQRMQKDKKVATKFIDEAFSYLKKEIPDYKNKKYYENRSIFNSIIEKNKILTKIYVILYKK